MRWLLSLLIAWPLSLFGAAGDITGVAIETNGWQVLVYVDGLATNGTYASFGFGANNTITGNEKLVVNLTSQGYDSTGTATTVPRTVYGTLRVRFPYPSDAFADTLVVGSDVRLSIALSDYVYAGDSNITANISAGLYTQGAANAAGTGLTVTNLSTLSYPKPVANWTWPGWQRETGSTMRLRAVGFHSSARNGKPLAAMKFIATDESGDSVTNTVTDMTIDRTLPDLFPSGEYVTDIALTSLTDHNQIRCDFAAYPWIGDSGAVLDTRSDTYTGLTPLPTSITNFLDAAINYSPFIAVVDPSGGNDTNGKATNVPYSSVNSAQYFLTVTAAWNNIAASNNVFGTPTHNDPGGGIVYIRTTGTPNFNWTGGTLSAGAIATAKCWAETMTYPGDVQAVITNRANDRNVGHRVKLTNIKIAVVDPAVPFNGIGQAWFNQCRFDTAGTALIQTVTNVYVTHCLITNLAQGLQKTSQNVAFRLIRGNNLDNFNNPIHTFTLIGNSHPTTNGGAYSIIDTVSGTGTPNPDYTIIYNNYFAGNRTANPMLSVGGGFDLPNGSAIVQNIFEQCGTTASPVAGMYSSGSHPSTNILYWHNITTGERIADMGSSGSETATINRIGWSVKGNMSDLTGFKKDYNATADADRIGNWGLMWMAGGANNNWIECRVNSAAGSFPPDFAGLWGMYPTVTNTIDYARYVDRKSYAGDGAASAGGGNYRVKSDAPQQVLAATRATDWILPFDIEGNHRGLSDPPGAYASANPRKAAGFFAP